MHITCVSPQTSTTTALLPVGSVLQLGCEFSLATFLIFLYPPLQAEQIDSFMHVLPPFLHICLIQHILFTCVFMARFERCKRIRDNVCLFMNLTRGRSRATKLEHSMNIHISKAYSSIGVVRKDMELRKMLLDL